MAMVDKFIILKEVQFEKNGYQNRYRLSTKEWITKPILHGMEKIRNKRYADGQDMLRLNMQWIYVIRDTLGINTDIIFDRDYGLSGTDHLVRNVKEVGGSVYVTNPEAKEKYLEEEKFMENGIVVGYCRIPKNLDIHIFEAFNVYGIEGVKKLLPKEKVWMQRDGLKNSNLNLQLI